MDIEVHTANLPSGEPAVVIQIDKAATVLRLQDAMDLGQAIIKAVAASEIKDPIAPVEPSLIQLPN